MTNPPAWADDISEEAREQIKGITKWLESAFKKENLDVTSPAFKLAFENIADLDPLLFAYAPEEGSGRPDESGHSYYRAAFEAVKAAGYDNIESQKFINVFIASQDIFDTLIAELAKITATPYPKVPNEDLPPEMKEIARGGDLQLWDLNIDEGVDLDSLTGTTAFALPVIVLTIPAWLKAVIVISISFASLFGDQGEKDIFAAFAQAIRRVGRKIKKLFKKIFGW